MSNGFLTIELTGGALPGLLKISPVIPAVFSLQQRSISVRLKRFEWNGDRRDGRRHQWESFSPTGIKRWHEKVFSSGNEHRRSGELTDAFFRDVRGDGPSLGSNSGVRQF